MLNHSPGAGEHCSTTRWTQLLARRHASALRARTLFVPPAKLELAPRLLLHNAGNAPADAMFQKSSRLSASVGLSVGLLHGAAARPLAT